MTTQLQENLFVLEHPLKGQYLKNLRDKNSSPEVVREQTKKLGHLLAIEVTRDLQTSAQKFETPICESSEDIVAQEIGLFPILRAGIGLVDPFLDFLPQAQVHFLGMFRDEATHQPVSYYSKLPDKCMAEVCYVLDPMLATGGSAIMTIEALKKWGATDIKFIGLIGAPEGVKALHEVYPDVEICLAALDERLNEHAYIVPGLGDAGDRIFNSN